MIFPHLFVWRRRREMQQQLHAMQLYEERVESLTTENARMRSHHGGQMRQVVASTSSDTIYHCGIQLRCRKRGGGEDTYIY